MGVDAPGSAAPVNYTSNTAAGRTTSETYAHSLPVVTAEASAVGAEPGIVVAEAGIYVVVTVLVVLRAKRHGRPVVPTVVEYQYTVQQTDTTLT